MIKQLRSWLEPPVFPEDEEKSTLARTMNTLGLYFVLAMALTTLIYIPLYAERKLESWAAMLSILIIYPIARAFLFRGKLELAGMLIVVWGWILCEGLAYLGGGITSPVNFTLFAVTIAVGLMYPPRTGFAFLILSILFGLGFAVLQQRGIRLPQFFVYSPLEIWFYFALSLVFIHSTIYLSVHKLKHALALALGENAARKKAEMTLRENEEKYRLLFDNASDAIFIHDEHQQIVAANLLAVARFGYTPQELTSVKIGQLDASEVTGGVSEQLARLTSQGRQTFETVHRRKDGELIPTEVSAQRINWNGKTAVMSICRDISARKRAQEAEHEQRTLAEALSDSAAVLNSTLDFAEVLDRILDNAGRVVAHDSVGVFLLDQARQTAQIVGYRDQRAQAVEMNGFQFPLEKTRNLREIVETRRPVIIADTHAYEGWVAAPSNVWIRSNLGVPIEIKGEIIGFLVLANSKPHAFTSKHAVHLQAFANHAAIVIENARLYTDVQNLALIDSLTGVFNRAFFETELKRLQLGRDFPVSIIVADLDNMKITNDRLGHAAGDELLRHTVQLLKAVFRSSDVVARIGGDEFAIVLPKVDSKTVGRMLARFHKKLGEHNLQFPDLPIQISIGAATAEQGGLTEAFILADQRMYAEKAAHKGR